MNGIQQKLCLVCHSPFASSPWNAWKVKTCSKSCSQILDYRTHRSAYLLRAKRNAQRNRKRVNATSRRYRKRNTLKCSARSAVGTAIRNGTLVRPSRCSSCGRKCRPQAHHRNGYRRALDVIWLCSECHGLETSGLSLKEFTLAG